MDAIADAAKPRKKPQMFFMEEDVNMEGQVKVIAQTQAVRTGDTEDDSETQAERLRAYQVETMKLKDELMQMRVDAFEQNQKMESKRV